MGIFRSEEMSLCQLFVSSEAAYNSVSELGELGLVQFRDLNEDVNSFQRKYVHEVRRCDEMERILRYLEKEFHRSETPIIDNGDNPEAPQPKEMVDLEATFEKLENELQEVNNNAEALKKNYLELTELKHVLEKTKSFFDEREDPSASLTQNLIPAEEGQGPVQLGFVAGVIRRERMPGFERMLWRVCRGNVFVRQQEIEIPLEDPITGAPVHKVVYMIFFQGEQLKAKVKKICEGCRSTMYPCPDNLAERKEMLQGVRTRLDDLNTVLSQTNEHRHRVLQAVAKHIRTWFIKVRKIKAIYHTLNHFNIDVTSKCLIGECWIPDADFETIEVALKKGADKSGSSMQPILNRMETRASPPTFHRTNKFTKGFQALIDSYGVASYREVNPALYTTTTFPFLFAIMFGDFGHGLIMAIFGLWMVLMEDKLSKIKGEIWGIVFGGRYIILLMGFFSVYTGFMYNDVFSKSFNVFGSSFSINPEQDAEFFKDHKDWMLNPGNRSEYSGVPYPIGIDPIWQVSLNKINFLNGYKMKTSIIIGVVHMMFGVILSMWNHTYFKRTMNIFCEFIPQVLFMLCLFGWLCIMVFNKWVNYGEGPGFDDVHNSACAPSVLIIFINMMLMKVDEMEKPCEPFMFEGQQQLQMVLVVIAVISVPVMLIPKPFLLRRQHRQRALQRQQQIEPSTSDGVIDTVQQEEEEEEFEMSEVFIHQAIHTIEYVLGSVSHTASYLRLWALSLAHAELAEVLWSMVLRVGLSMTPWYGSIILYCTFAAWAVLTLAILVLMEGLSAFLHTLRLHWVEFQSKFYRGEGYAFEPFAFKNFVNDEESG